MASIDSRVVRFSEPLEGLLDISAPEAILTPDQKRALVEQAKRVISALKQLDVCHMVINFDSEKTFGDEKTIVGKKKKPFNGLSICAGLTMLCSLRFSPGDDLRKQEWEEWHVNTERHLDDWAGLDWSSLSQGKISDRPTYPGYLELLIGPLVYIAQIEHLARHGKVAPDPPLQGLVRIKASVVRHEYNKAEFKPGPDGVPVLEGRPNNKKKATVRVKLDLV